jgi:hypothetical protein
MAINRKVHWSMLGSTVMALSLVLGTTAGAAGKTPGAPRLVHASAGNRSATVRWKAPLSNGGNPVLYYVVTASPSNAKCKTKTLTCTFHGLKHEKYTFTVDAVTKNGVGTPSGLSNPVKPSTPTPTTTQPPL